MSVFLDASAIVAILGREPDRETLIARLDAADGRSFVSALVIFEATIALARKKVGPGVRLSADDIDDARASMTDFLSAIDAQNAPLSMETGLAAIEAASRFSKYVGHPAGLNMGDAFAYASAKAVGAARLFKGGDFTKTDISVA